MSTVCKLSTIQELQRALPSFVLADRSASVSLKAVVAHRTKDSPDPEDIRAIMGKLLDHFTGLAKVKTGDENTDAEMRVYCTYNTVPSYTYMVVNSLHLFLISFCL